MNSLKQKWVAQKRALDGLDQSIEVGPTAEGQGTILENPKQAQRVSQAEVQQKPVIQAKSLDTDLLAQFLGTDPEFYQDAAEIRRKTEKELSMNQKIEAEFSNIFPKPSTPTPELQNPKTEPPQESLESKMHSIQKSEAPKDSINTMNARNLSLSKTNDFLQKENHFLSQKLGNLLGGSIETPNRSMHASGTPTNHPDRRLNSQNQYLKQENKILLQKLERLQKPKSNFNPPSGPQPGPSNGNQTQIMNKYLQTQKEMGELQEKYSQMVNLVQNSGVSANPIAAKTEA